MTRPYTINGKYGLYTEAEIAAEQARLYRLERLEPDDDDGDGEDDEDLTD